MNYYEILDEIKKIILQVAEEQDVQISGVKESDAIVDDLGFSSLDVATLTAYFEEAFGVYTFL